MSREKDALEYHEFPRPGKIAIRATKACETAHDLSLAYSPGVAVPCLRIAENPLDAYRYTSKGNLVAVISNGTAVLGLGNIGPLASKPVMEGKGVLFKSFADIDVFDIELDCPEVDRFVDTVAALAPTFGGINLEDIKAPECFAIEEALIERLDIPVFHDDQHGTAIIASAALLNALELTNRKIGETSIIINGAGAAAIASARLLVTLGVKKENITLCDSKGVVSKARESELNEYKREFIKDIPETTLEEVIEGADVFFGLSAKDALLPSYLKKMAKNPIVFAMANPDPEIDYPTAVATRDDVIMATGRSDFPNQVNNVLCFPFLFRGALDVGAKVINPEMKLAAVNALASLAKEPVTESVRRAYGNDSFSFGKEYLIPKPFDPRVLYHVSPAVAKAAIDSGVATRPVDIESYTFRLRETKHHGRSVLRSYYSLARSIATKRIAFPEGANPKVLRAAEMALVEDIAVPVLIGDRTQIEATARELAIEIDSFEIVEPDKDSRLLKFIETYYSEHSRKGVSKSEAERLVRSNHVFANYLLVEGDVDGLICGIDENYPSMARPILEIVGLKDGVKRASGMYLVTVGERILFFADTTLNLESTAESLAETAIMAAEFAKSLDVTPRIAMLSCSNFGSVQHPSVEKVRAATKIVQEALPDLQVDGEVQADTAVVSEILQEKFPFSKLKKPANILIFPEMEAGNISYKLLQRLGGARVIGPVILGVKEPAFVMQRHASVDEIFSMITIAVAQAALP